MAGKPPDASSSGAPKKPFAKSFSCGNCGATVTVNYPNDTLSVACESCHATIDTMDPNYRILTTYESKQTYKPRIPLGSRGKLFGRLWEVIGFVVRCDNRTRYAWEEYLLFNPYYGYRWLAVAEGHWNFVETIKAKPEVNVHGAIRSTVAFLEAKRYPIFYAGDAEVLYVFGEFYWKVMIGSMVKMADYIDPPMMLSSESDATEVIWSRSTYVEPDVIAKAFGDIKPKIKLASRKGIGPNQPTFWSKVWKDTGKSWAIMLLLVTTIQIYNTVTAENRTVLEIPYSFPSNAKRPDITTPVFEVDRPFHNLKITINASVDNSWFWVSGELVNDTTGESFPFERSVEYYHGVDGGESWSEGGTSQTVLISRLAAGKYYINMDTESGDFRDSTPHSFTVIVQRAVTTYSNYFWSLFFVSIFPFLAWLFSRNETVSRWSQSDFSPYGTGD